MVLPRRPLFSFLLAAGVLVHLNVFRSLKSIGNNDFECVGDECAFPIHSSAAKHVRDSTNDSRVDPPLAVIQDKQIEPLQSLLESSKEPVHLVYAADSSDGSLEGVAQSIKSVMHFASEPVVFHFIGESPLPSLPNVKYYNLTKVTHEHKLEDFTNPKKRDGKKRKTLNSSLANYVRFIMDSLLPDVSKAMWIDADTIVKCDVVPMMRSVLTQTNYTVAAVEIKGQPNGLSKAAKKMFPGIKRTFNAGVFVVDLDRWRERKLTEKVRKLSLLNKKKKLYLLGSQPPLTLVIGNEFESLSPAWNVKVPFVKEYFKENGDKANVCLVHWVGGRKPWETKMNLRSTHKEWWYKYKDEKPITRKSLNDNKKEK